MKVLIKFDNTNWTVEDELIPAASLVLTVGVILAGGYVMSYLVKIEEENVQKTLGAKGLKVR